MCGAAIGIVLAVTGVAANLGLQPKTVSMPKAA